MLMYERGTIHKDPIHFLRPFYLEIIDMIYEYKKITILYP
jgi:hypothetical protein